MGPWDSDIQRNLTIYWLLRCGLADDTVKYGDGGRTTDILIVCRLECLAYASDCTLFKEMQHPAACTHTSRSIVGRVPYMLLDSALVGNFTILSVKLNP
jgi:hypothetical protein